MRVRCPITPADMLHISTNCRTAEKMALTLLDYLFHREIQAISNLSGQGKHGKKQLDPLMIYGIRCEYNTGTSEVMLRREGSKRLLLAVQLCFVRMGYALVLPDSWFVSLLCFFFFNEGILIACFDLEFVVGVHQKFFNLEIQIQVSL